MANNTGIIKPENILSFSPTDISIYMYNQKVGNCMAVTYSIQREVVALFAMGDPNAQGFNRGKRGIAGSLVFNVYQNHPLLRSPWASSVGITKSSQLKNIGNLRNADLLNSATGLVPAQGTVNMAGSNIAFGGGAVDLDDNTVAAQLAAVYNATLSRAINYADQLPPFDIVLTFVNEEGDAAMMAIHDVIIGNENGGYSVDDITSEVAFTYIARKISPLQAYVGKGITSSGTIQSGGLSFSSSGRLA